MAHNNRVPERRSFGACGIAGACLLVGCVDTIDVDANETQLEAPLIAEFDPQSRAIPLPNNLLLDPQTGHVSVPASCGEQPDSPAARVRAALNQLDGFGTSGVNLVATFSAPLDADSLTDRVFVLRLAERGMPLPEPERVAFDFSLGKSRRFSPDCAASREVDNLVLRPQAPLAESSTYAVVLLAGIASASGVVFEPSATWGLVRQSVAPVQFVEGPSGVGRLVSNTTPFDPTSREGLASLQGLDRLWRAHAPLLGAWDRVGPRLTATRNIERDSVLLAWSFNTQTLSDVLDPRAPGSPASVIESTSDALSVPAPLAGEGAPLSIEAFFAAALPNAPCSALGCEAIGWIYTESAATDAPSFVSPSFLQGDDCARPATLASGPFNDPLMPDFVCDRRIPLLAVVPLTPPAAAGYPTVVFGHGLGRSKEDLLAIAGSLARAGFASVAFDAVDHGTRAVPISSDPALGCDRAGSDRPCADTFGPTCAPQCFAPLLSTDLAATRDHLRQTLLDQRQLERVLSACGEADCGRLRVDPERIVYMGHALGALLGGVGVATSDTLAAAVLNEPAGDWVSVLTETSTDAIRCPLVDSLIAGGVLSGTPWAGGDDPDALCLGEGWKADPRFQEFASTARWLLDPVDPLNYAARFRTGSAPPVLLAEIDADPVIPNTATRELVRLIGLDFEPAAAATSATAEPTPAALAAGNVWIRYSSLPGEPESGFPGNAYGPGSLLAPAPVAPGMGDAAGQLGTVRLRVDALGYLGSRR